MHFDHSDRAKEWMARVQKFMDDHVYPNEQLYEDQMTAFGVNRWQIPQILEDLKAKAKAEGLWNMFMPPHSGAPKLDETFHFESPGLDNVEYAPLAEIMGRVGFASEVFNCSAPDTGNMEVFERFGTRAQKDQWLRPLMEGKIRSAFLMTEPAVASSDATNIQTEIRRDGDDYVINGRKWWSSGVSDPHCDVYIVMGKTDPNAAPYNQQSMILVPKGTPGVTNLRNLPVFGFDDAPHGHSEVLLENVRVPAANLLLGEGRGFEIAQGRLGPGRIHHAMRNIGVAERALEKMCKRLLTRKAFGKIIAEHSVWEQRIGQARASIEQARLLVYKAAWKMDKFGNKAARDEIAMIKVSAPHMAIKIVDDAIQAHGAGGVTTDFGLARAYAKLRTMRIVDGPDEVHLRQLARTELKKYAPSKKH